MGAARTSPESFRGLFLTALRLAASERPGAVVEIVRAVATEGTRRSAGGLRPGVAEATRVRVFEEWLQETGQERTLCAGADPVEPVEGVGVLPDGEGDPAPVQVPRGRSLPDERVRRGGSRR